MERRWVHAIGLRSVAAAGATAVIQDTVSRATCCTACWSSTPEEQLNDCSESSCECLCPKVPREARDRAVASKRQAPRQERKEARVRARARAAAAAAAVAAARKVSLLKKCDTSRQQRQHGWTNAVRTHRTRDRAAATAQGSE